MSEETRTVEPHYTLQEAVDRFFPGGHITVRSLRTEIRKGRLRVTEVAGKFLVTERALVEMLEACRRCPAPESHRGFISNDDDPRGAAPGLSETDRLKHAQDAARITIAELAKPSHVTLPQSTNRQARFRSRSSTSTKS
jgi:hypothetical protein